WDEVLAVVSRKSKKAAAVVREATVRDVDGDTLVLVFKHSVHATMLTNSPDVLIEALYELLGGQWKIRCELGGQAGGGSSNPRLQGQQSRPATGPPGPMPGPTQNVGATTGTAEDWPTPARLGGP